MADPNARKVSSAELLLVENDERIAELLAWFLRRRGFAVRVAPTYAEAARLLRAKAPDLMLADVEMGAESGRIELPRLSEAGILPPTLVVSGYIDEEIGRELSALPGVLGLFPKPFEFPELEAKLRAVLPPEGARAADGTA